MLNGRRELGRRKGKRERIELNQSKNLHFKTTLGTKRCVTRVTSGPNELNTLLVPIKFITVLNILYKQ